MKYKYLLLAIALCAFASNACAFTNQNVDKPVDYTSIRAKERELLQWVEFAGWWTNDRLVDMFIEILRTEKEAAMTYGFDSLTAITYNAHFVYSNDSMMREFQFRSGSSLTGYIKARLYNDNGTVRFVIPAEEDLCGYSTLDYFHIEGSKYLRFSFYRGTCGDGLFIKACVYDFSKMVAVPKFVTEVEYFMTEETGCCKKEYFWNDEDKSFLLPKVDGDRLWHGEYVKYKWNGSSFEFYSPIK